MHVRRGTGDSLPADRAATEALVDHVAETDEPGIRVWYPPSHVAFGRRDSNGAAYDRAREIAADRGYAPVERTVGGRAVAFTGAVLALAFVEPAEAAEPELEARYERTLARLADGLASLGADVRRGEPPESFCPGTHSLQAEGGKIAGLAQRVKREVAVVGGAVIVADAEAVADVLEPVYDALGLAFDPESVASVGGACGGAVDPDAVQSEIEAAFVGDRPTTAVNVRDT